MVKLRAAHKTLKIVLFSVLGAIVAAAGTVGIVMITRSIQSPSEPELTTNVKTDPGDLTPADAVGDEDEAAKTLYYLAYVLDTQDTYSVEAVNSSGSMGITSTTRTYKDYYNGVMIATDITTGITKSAVQTCYIKDADGVSVAYRRTGSNITSSSTVSDITWDEVYSNTYYYYRTEEYLKTYGEFSTEMTVYLINEDTIESYSAITDNGDGTYTQSFVFNDSAGWWYQYAMYTNGGLDDYPEFDKIEMTVTFDSSWRVLQIVVEEDTVVEMVGTFNTSATTTTTFTYGEINTENYAFYETYYTAAMPEATAGGESINTASETSALTVLQAAFSKALGANGDQFAVTLDMGGVTYYGYIYLKIDLSASDILNNLDIRLTLSTDETCDSQDLYIELKGGDVNAYYSSNFALTADISEVSSVISQFSEWAGNYSYGTAQTDTVQAASAKLTADDSSSFDLSSLLGAIQMTENGDGTADITLALEDLYGIDAYVKIVVTVTETAGEDGNTTKSYSFKSAYIGDLSYNDNAVELEINLAPTEVTTISHIASETAFDLSEAMSSIYAILNSTSMQVDLELDGEKIVTLANSILKGSEYIDYIALLSDYDIKASAVVDITGITTQASVVITSDSLTVIDIDVYYAYDGSSAYGIAYLTINNIMGEECAVKAYCDISDLADGITRIIALAQGETGTTIADSTAAEAAESGTEGSTDTSATIVAIINAVLGLDFSECITVTAQNTTITASLDADKVIDSVLSAMVGGNMTLGMDVGEIALTYEYSTDEGGSVLAGTLTLEANTVGIGLVASGSDITVTEPDASNYLDLTKVANSVYALLASESIQLDMTLTGKDLVTLVTNLAGSTYADYVALMDGYTVDVTAYVDITGITTQLSLTITRTSDKVTVIAADIYYAYDGTSDYGTAYVSITKLMDVTTEANVYCDIADLVDSIETIIDYVSNNISLASEEQEEANSTVALIQSILALDYSAIIKSITTDTNSLTAMVNADTLLALLIPNVKLTLGDIALDYSYEEVEGVVQPGELTLNLTGVSATLKASDTEVTEPDSSNYLDLTTLAASVYELLASDSIQLDMTLTGKDLVTLLDNVTGNEYTDYINLIKDYTVDVTAYVDITGITTQLNLVITDTNKVTVLAADIYYAYDGTSDYGIAYVSINTLMDVTTDANVYCDIADLVDSIETIINYVSNNISLASEEQEEANSTVALIQSILALDYSEIIGSITTDTNKLTATVNADTLLALLIPNVKLTLGDIALDYSYEEVEGVVQPGELTLNLTGISATLKASDIEVTEPDSSNYLDLTKVVNSVYELLASESIQLDMTLTGKDLVTLVTNLAGSTYADYVALMDGYTVDVTAYVDITGITTQLSLTITRTSDKVTVLAADIYYAYDGTSDYGIAYVSITKLMDVTTEANVYCDIADLVDSIETIINYVSNNISLASEEQEEANSTVALIQSILSLDYSAIIKSITTDTNSLTATVNADTLLALLIPNVKLTLGDIALDYSYEEVEGVVQPGELTLNLTGVSATLKASDTEVTEPDASNYLDLTSLAASVYELLASDSIQLDMTLTGKDLVTLLDNVTGNGYTDYINLIKDYTVDVTAYVDITGITTQLSLVITDTNKVTVLAADIYYAYDGTSDYGIAYVSINTLMDVETETNVYCDIADLVDSIETIIDYVSNNISLASEEQEEANSTVALIQSILALDYSEIIGSITTDTNSLTATVNADTLLALLIPNVKLTLGDIALDYSYEEVEGVVQPGELTLNLTGISATLKASTTEVTEPDSSNYLDLTKVVNSVYALLASESVQLDMTLTGKDLVTLVTNLAGSAYADYVALMDGYTVDVTAYVDITGITTQLSLTITRTSDKVTVLDADIYYAYDGTSDYGIAYVSITKLMDVETDANVYCDIADLVDSIETIIDYVSKNISLASEEQEEVDSTVALIQSILALDYSAIVKSITTDTNKLTATVNADTLLALLIPNVKLTLGDIALDYSYEDVEGVVQPGELTLNLTGISATLKASTTEVTEPDSSNYLDLTTLAASVYELLASDSIQLDMAIDGSALVNIINSATNSEYATYLSILKGYNIAITANVNLDCMVQANVKVTGTNLTVLDADIYYEYDGTSGSYGIAYIKVTTLMNVACSVKGYCNIKDLAASINDIISIVEGTTGATVSDDDDDEDTLTTAELIGKILAIDYTKIVDSITIDAANGITASIDADAIVALFLSDITLGLGDVALDYNYNTDEKGNVTAGELSLALTGVTVTITSSTTAVTQPAGTGTYVNLTYLANSIANAAVVALDIAEDGASFDISGVVEVNDSAISVDGTGEVVLTTTEKTGTDGKTTTVTTLKSVAVDVTLAVTNGIYGNDGTTPNDVTLQVVYLADNYTSTATDPFLYVVINGTGISVTYSEYASFTAEMTSVYETICALLGEEENDEGGTGSGSDSGSSVTITDSDVLEILEFITGAFADTTMLANINSVAGLLNNFTITLDEKGGINVVYANDESSISFNVAVTTADDALTLVTDIADLNVSVSAYNGKTDLAGSLITDFSDTESCTTTNLSGMIALVYGYVFRCVDDVDIKSIFGSDAYELAITLDGDESGIKALAGVYVDASATAGIIDSKNIYTIDADMDISGFTVKLSMVYYDGDIYVNISEIGGTQFTDLLVKAATDDIYSVVASVVDLIMNEDVLTLVNNAIAWQTVEEDTDNETEGGNETEDDGTEGNETEGGTETNTQTEEGISTASDDGETEQTKSTLTAVLEMLTSILKGNILTVSTSSGTSVVIDIDGLLSPFGITAGAGKLTIDVVTDDNGTFTGIDADMTITTEGTAATWLTLTAGGTDSAKYTAVETTGSDEGTFYTDSYVDIGFAAQLVKDAVIFAKSGIQKSSETGDVTGVKYTFTGTIDITAVSIVNITLSDIVLTVGYGSEGIYINMSAYMEADTGIASILVSMDSYNIGITYYNNLLTLARNVGSSSEIYYVMTFDYFIDYLFSTDSDGYDSPLRWLTNCTGWSTVIGILDNYLDLDSISSGLKDTSEVFLYEVTQQAATANIISIFSDYITSFAAVFTDSENTSTYSYGNYSSMVSKLSLSNYTNGYYAVDLASSLTSGVLTTLYAAITRDATYGLGSILAYAAIDSYVTINVNLAYDPTQTAADNYYTIATGSITDGKVVDGTAYGNTTPGTGESYVFGAAKIEDGEVNYLDSLTLADVYYYVYDTTGAIIAEGVVKYGSTVYTYSLTDPVYTSDKTEVVAYSNIDGSATAAEYYVLNKDICTEDEEDNTWSVNFYMVELPVYNVDVNYTLTSVDGTQTDEETYVILKGNAFGTTLTYDGYTLLNVYTDEECTQVYDYTTDALTSDLTLYAQFVKTEETINGVTYTFTNSSAYSYAGSQYTLSGTLDTSGYYEITAFDFSYSDEWLVLENEVNGYPVIAIINEAFNPGYSSGDATRDSLTKVLVPENIIYVGTRAFAYHESITTIVFLADTIYLDNGSGNGRAYYPFYTDSSSDNSALTVYYNNYIAMGEEKTSTYEYVFICSYYEGILGTGWGAYTYYVNYTTDWTYYNEISVTTPDSLEYEADDIESDVVDVIKGYTYDAELYGVNGAYFYTSSLDITSAVEEALLAIINAYTASENTNGYINGYTVTVSISGYTITVAVAAIDNPYYKTTVAYDENSESKTLSSISFAIDDATAYAEYNGAYYVQEGNVTVTVIPVGSYKLSSVVYNDNEYKGDAITENTDGSYSFVIAVSTVDTITLNWTKIAENTITIYSEVEFTYGTKAATPVDTETKNYYTLGATAANAGATDNVLGDLNAAVGYENYYFLGYAVESTSLTFTTISTDVFDMQGSTIYYAIWGYNKNSTLTVSTATSGTALPKPTAASSGEFYAWYTGYTKATYSGTVDTYVANYESSATYSTTYSDYEYVTFSGKTNDDNLTNGSYTYYARMQFTLTYTFSGNTDSEKYYCATAGHSNSSTYEVSNTGDLTIYEGEFIYVTYLDYTYNNSTGSEALIGVYDSFANYIAESPSVRVTYYMRTNKQGSGQSNKKTRYLNPYYTSNNGDIWSYTGSTSTSTTSNYSACISYVTTLCNLSITFGY